MCSPSGREGNAVSAGFWGWGLPRNGGGGGVSSGEGGGVRECGDVCGCGGVRHEHRRTLPDHPSEVAVPLGAAARDASQGREVTPPPQPLPSRCLFWRQVPASMAFVTASNRPQPLRKPPPTACLPASGAASDVPSLQRHPWPQPGGLRRSPVPPPGVSVLVAGRSPCPNAWESDGVAMGGSRATPPPPCDILYGCCFFMGPWTVPRSSLRMLRRVAAFCQPLRPVLLLVSFPRSRSPVVGAPGLCCPPV